MPDWHRPEAYDFTVHLTREQWAWEFLRRNPDYRREWAAFDATWRALETAYGSPPHRDFPAWRQDPRAWVQSSASPDGACRVDQDKVLVECALGSRWGFHKFPPDPAADDPIGAGLLAWREVAPDGVREIGPCDLADLDSDPALLVLGFDLSRPLRGQIEQAKRHLQMVQRRRVREGAVTLATVAGLRAEWTGALRLLDAEAAGAGPYELAALCDGESADGPLAQAHRLRELGYLEILALPER
jgi:hypothetical protein